MKKNNIVIVSLFLIIMISIVFTFTGTNGDSNTASTLDNVENRLNNFEVNDNVRNNNQSDIFPTKYFNENKLINSLSILKVALQQLTKQNDFLQNQIIISEKKTNKINSVLNNLWDKINLIPVSINSTQISSTSSALFKFDSSRVSQDVIKLCQEQIANFYVSKSDQEDEMIDRKLNEEPIDFMWSENIDTMLMSLIEKNNLTGSDIASVNCHASVCEIIIKHVDQKSKINFAAKLPKDLKFNFSNNNDPSDLTEVLFLMGNNN